MRGSPKKIRSKHPLLIQIRFRHWFLPSPAQLERKLSCFFQGSWKGEESCTLRKECNLHFHPRYCFTEGVSLPFQILPTIKELGQTLMQVNVKVKSVFGVKMFALVVIRIPVPKQTVKQVSKSHLVEQSIMLPIDSLLWKIRKFPGQTKPTLSAEVELISIMAEKRSWMRPPIQMEFEVWEKSELAILPRAGLAHMRSAASSLG